MTNPDPKPKKKLPTGPIRITPPSSQRSETLTEEVIEKEPTNQILEKQKQDSGIPENGLAEAGKLDSGMLESSFIDSSKPESSLVEVSKLDSSNQETRLSDVANEESGDTNQEYKKVAMRLSAEALENLKHLRASTGIPYEILVDVMIRNWDNLPQRTRAAYLQQAKQIRGERLVSGQEKTLKTLQAKYSGNK